VTGPPGLRTENRHDTTHERSAQPPRPTPADSRTRSNRSQPRHHRPHTQPPRHRHHSPHRDRKQSPETTRQTRRLALNSAHERPRDPASPHPSGSLTDKLIPKRPQNLLPTNRERPWPLRARHDRDEPLAWRGGPITMTNRGRLLESPRIPFPALLPHPTAPTGAGHLGSRPISRNGWPGLLVLRS
jgi:hypothetical protein